MKKILGIAAASFAAFAFSSSANAGVVDFVDYAAGNEHGIASGDTVVIGGETITFTSNFKPYFDDLSGGPGGLGVCRNLAGGAVRDAVCTPAGDDSTDGDMGVDEWVELSFDDGPFDLKGLSFTDGRHKNLNNNNVGLVGLMVNSVDLGAFTFAAAVLAAKSGIFGAVDTIRFTYIDTEFYVNSLSDVPIPGALPLLLSGIAGLGFASRRKKKLA